MTGDKVTNGTEKSPTDIDPTHERRISVLETEIKQAITFRHLAYALVGLVFGSIAGIMAAWARSIFFVPN